MPLMENSSFKFKFHNMKIYQYLLVLGVVLLTACGGGRSLSNRYTYEDKAVFDLIERLNKNPADREASRQLPEAYSAAVSKRKQVTSDLESHGQPGLRFEDVAKEWAVVKQMYEQVKKSPAATRALSEPWDPSNVIDDARQKAVEEYYEQGMTFMSYNTRDYAQKAYDNFSRAAKISPGYRDINRLLNEAASRATLRVLVNPVNYYRYNWSYWGFQSDFLQQQMVRDLNSRAWANVRFYSDWEIKSQQLVPDRIVDLVFTDLFIDQLHSDSRSYQRSAQIETGQTKTNPPKPVYTTVTATVFVNRRYLTSYATLECRIYDRETNRDIVFDRFPDRFDWKQETARFTGDKRALSSSDWALINNRFNDYPPSRNQIADRLVRNCYQLMISRIQSASSF
jgi:hypothetical protein